MIKVAVDLPLIKVAVELPLTTVAVELAVKLSLITVAVELHLITRKPIKRLTHQEFDRAFKLSDQGEYGPPAERLLQISVEDSS